jgi:uncharacterized phiE125 gp8 family phage protein
MALQIVTPPTAYPIDLSDAKLHLRVTFSADDSLITGWIAAARDYAQDLTGKQLVVGRFNQYMDSFPALTTGVPYGRASSRPPNAIFMERNPLLQVVSINYIDTSGVQQTIAFPNANYVVDYASDPVRITPVFGQIWPIAQPQIGAVWVTFDAGFAVPFTASGNNLTVVGGPALAVNAVIRLSNSGGALPSPLKPLTDYYIKTAPGGGVYTLSATSGGAVITLADSGSGTSFVGEIPWQASSWMKLRLASMYENREEIGSGSIITPLPYADRLLDGLKTYF